MLPCTTVIKCCVILDVETVDSVIKKYAQNH